MAELRNPAIRDDIKAMLSDIVVPRHSSSTSPGKVHNLSEAERSFYDALAQNESAVEVMGNDEFGSSRAHPAGPAATERLHRAL